MACRRCCLGCVLAVAALGCADPNDTEAPAGDVPLGDAIARVGDVEIGAALTVAVASARQISPAEAVRGLIDDALMAERFDRDHPRVAAWTSRALLARHLEQEFMVQARAAGAATPAELAEFTQRHWWMIDRPPAARVVHAVVLCDEACPNASEAAAVADAIAEATRDKTDSDSFVAAARDVPTAGLDVRVEELSLVTADGRIVALGRKPGPNYEFGRYHEQFARAANAIAAVGQQGRARSPSGFHVMMLLERQPEQRMAEEGRAELLLPEILAARAKKLQDAVLERLRSETPVEVTRSFAQDTERLLSDP